LKEYDIIITSPEMALSHTHLRPILANPTVNCDIDLLVVDEAHCTVRWGEDFRVKYSDLTDLRRLLPARTSCLAMSATMPPEILAGVRNVLSIDEKHSYHINLGNDRRNIAQIVVPLKQNESLLEQLAVLLCNLQPDKRGHLVRALCFFGSRATTQQASAFVKRKLRDSGLDLRVHYIHAGLTPKARAEIMRRFVNHQIDILFATDAVGSGQNLADIEVVVVVDRPSGSKSFKLPELLQWLGRAGRDNQPARGYIMAEWTLFQRVKPRKPKNEDVDRTVLSMQDVLELDSDNSDGPTAATSGLVHRKKIDPHLRAYFKATSCRRAFLNQHFENRCCVRRKSVMSLTGFA
jgi:ATP-dependent DNA helicase RecQ